MKIVDAVCAKCKKNISFSVSPLELANGPTVSTVVLNHKEPQKCPYCGQLYGCAIHHIAGVELKFLPLQTPVKKEKDTIIPATAADLKKLKEIH